MLSQAGIWTGAWAATAAYAVNDLPGGPAVNQLNLHPAATKIAEEQHWLHWMMMIICTVIFIAVFAVMFYSIWKHRKSLGHKPANFHESVTVEVLWTLAPFLIVIMMSLPATKVLVASKDTTNADLTVKATGYQWKWGYDYIKGEGEGLAFISTLDSSQRAMSNAGKPEGDDYLLRVDNPLVVPVGKKIRVITTANDVIHALSIHDYNLCNKFSWPDPLFEFKSGEYFFCGQWRIYSAMGMCQPNAANRWRNYEDLFGVWSYNDYRWRNRYRICQNGINHHNDRRDPRNIP